MTLQQAEEKYGKVQNYIDNLKELMGLDDARASDYQDTLRDINFIREQAGLSIWNMEEFLTYLIY